MFEIKVTVDLPGIPEAINNLAAAMRGTVTLNTLEAETSNTQPEQDTTSAVDVSDAELAPGVTGNDSPLDSKPVQVTVSVNEPAPTPNREYTFDDISAAGAELCDRGTEMTERLVELLKTKYGVESIVDLPDSQINAIALDLQSMGAKMG